MKNLSAILRLSLTETITILITLVVCLAGFTEAEVHTNYRKQNNQQDENYHLSEASLKPNVLLAHQRAGMTEKESENRNFGNFKNFPDPSLEKLIQRHSDDFGEADESDERDSDGYGYDDDEYYHFNFKRNDESLENTKVEKEGVHDSNEKEGVAGQKFLNSKEKPKEIETIEMLNYKESHPNIDSNGNPIMMENTKPFSDDLGRKKAPSNTKSNILSSLKMSDLRGTSAIDEKMKDRKDESSLSSGSSESKTADTKKSVKVTEDKDTVKLKDSKLTEDSEQKEKEQSLKDTKEAVVGKNIKETTKSMEEKEKGVKLSESAKFEDNVDKLSSKTKENETPKLIKEETEIQRYSDKVNSDVINPSELNQINNRASFVSNDYKDNVDAMKAAGIEEDEKTSGESRGMENNVGVHEGYQGDLRRSREKYRKFYNQRDVQGNQNYGTQMLRETRKPKDYGPVAIEVQNLNSNNLFTKDWKEAGLEAMKILTQQPQLQQSNTLDSQQYLQIQQQLSQNLQSGQQQSEINSENRYKNAFGLNFQPADLENTEYHKNYIKSLKRYKSLNGEQKSVNTDTSTSSGLQAATIDEIRNTKKQLLEPVKRRSLQEKENAQSKPSKLRRNAFKTDSVSNQCPRISDTVCTVSKSAKDDEKLTEVKKQENNRARRKSPLKLEYEIKVINQSPQDSKNAELSHVAQRRFEKDYKTKLATEEKYLKKYPYSQVSRDDLMRLEESEGERKFKRKAPVWKRHDKKSVIQTRAVPSGYYSNRVKFGQKNYARNNERASAEPASFDTGRASSSFLISDHHTSAVDKNKLQRSWDVRPQDYKHDPIKRYDESGYMNKANSLLLVRKGQRTATSFEEGSGSGPDSTLNPDNLAKILSKDNDYIVLKKTDSNKFQKISESNPSNTANQDANGIGYRSKLSQETDQRENNVKQTLKSKGLFVRSYHPEKEEKKISSSSHNSKSNLKKTFDKFRDLAGFFKDNEQESTDNQYSAQELKEGRDIVFSEDKLPDPIVISSDSTGKNMGFKQKQQNSIYSISTNFKTLDQQDKKSDVAASSESDKNMFAEAKADTSESSWEPTLKNIFPEAKSVNAVNKNGNEIIILDLNRNQLKTTNYNNPTKMMPKTQFGAFGLTSQVPASVPADASIQMMLSPVLFPTKSASKSPQKSPFTNKVRNNRAYAVVRTADNFNQLSIRDLNDLPSLLKALSEKKVDTKLLKKRSPPRNTDGQISDNYQKFLSELNELSEMNKINYGKGKTSKKRTAEEIMLPPSSFPEMSTYGDANIKYLGNLLHNIMTGENPEFKGISGVPAESSDGGIPKSLEESLRSSQLYLNSEEPNVKSKYHRRSSNVEEKNKGDVRLGEDKARSNLLGGETSGNTNFQDELLAELAAASDKISRLRREGAETQKLTKPMEDNVDEKQKSGTVNASPQLKPGECSKPDSELKSEHNSKDSSDKSFLKSDYENHLSDFIESLNSNKNPKEQLNGPNENTWKRKKRKETHRCKRSASRAVKNKVSTTEVQNTILKNLAEDNYQSVYSPGIKRRLFSTNNEADEADNYSDGYKLDKNVIAEESQPKCVKNRLNKCIDPMIVELFRGVDNEDEKSRARRSLTSGFHSNFKREIDLDESMPNDFQNFLVTSLGGFGSQNREVIKKDVALWERKESTQDANQNVESSPLGKEDPNSNLEKREAPSGENRKGQTFFPSGANSKSNMDGVMLPLNHGEKKLRSDTKSKFKSKVEFANEKLPTQIRIQITNASSKEKKSSKPIMDESETTSTEVENLPKKEFFDKNKVNTLRLSNVPKLHTAPKNKLSFTDYDEPDNTDSSGAQSSYRLRRRRRKKKKYVPENPIKPIKDFIKFDQKAMETILKSIINNQNMMSGDQTTQKVPLGNHLVETVYNPTQGTNKAQLEVSRLGKMNAANNKNAGTVKNNLQSTEPIGYDEGILRNYLRDKTDKIKSDKVKDFEEIDWKPRYGKMRLRQDFGWEPSNGYNLATLKPSMTDSNSLSLTDSPSYTHSFNQHLYSSKSTAPTSNYFFHPSSVNSDNSNGLYDALKLKQEMKNQNELTADHSTTKALKKPYYYSNAGMFKMDDKDRSQNSLFSNMNMGDGAGWNYENTITKKPSPWAHKNRDFFSSSTKNQNHLDSKSKITHGSNRKFTKNVDDEKSSMTDAIQSSPALENAKDTDYVDNLGADEDYLEEEAGKELQVEEPVLPSKYHKLFNSDVEDNMNMNDDEEEVDEEYDENSEDDDVEDYSFLGNKAIDPAFAKNDQRKYQGSFNENNSPSEISYVYPKENTLELRGHNFEQTEFTNLKNDGKFSQGRQQIALADVKNDVGPLSSSTGLLKKANENANIFGKNLMKNIYSYDKDNHIPEPLPENSMNAFYHRNKLFKRKMESQGKVKRNQQLPQIGSRLFYAAKTEVIDNEPNQVYINAVPRKVRNGRHTYCRRNPLNAEFADPDNSFDGESEENGNGNLINLGKNLHEEDKTDRDEDAVLEDVAENLEDDGETISEDNVLENVIGKYIMRKRVADINKPDGNHKIHKRSLGKKKQEKAKVVKRLSSGHLTESNFRKYHRKNLTRKREVNQFDFLTQENAPEGESVLKKTRKRESNTLRKRSALDLFKKITNKDRDNKKVENVDGRTAGFEPLSSLSDKKYESSIRDAKSEFLNRVKKLNNECPQNQMKGNMIELKPHYEGQFTADQRKRDKVKAMFSENPATTGQGPWKIELNDRSDLKFSEFPNSLNNLKEVESTPVSWDNENLKAFLVLTNNLRAFKRSSEEDLSPNSGSSQKEVGNSYRPKSDEGRRISKMHVSKRSLDSSIVAINGEDAAQKSRDNFTGGQITESHVNVEEKNRALHDTKSLSEGDSKPPHVLQRNTKNIRSCENDDAQCPSTRFPSEGNLNNRKSVFPPSNEANIMRDSRQVNEETSKYLGQQIVDAIISHVSTNPKFKEMIAPGLAPRTTAYKEDIAIKKRPLHQADISEQLQFFLQKFMLDLERLAEKHVKKRMCTQIDEQSKEFLQSLLNIPDNSEQSDNDKNQNLENFVEKSLENIEGELTSTTATATTTTEAPKTNFPSMASLIQNSTTELENLRKKYCLLQKLIDDYEKLTELEKSSLQVHYQDLLEQLNQTNKDILSANPFRSNYSTKKAYKPSSDSLKDLTGNEPHDSLIYNTTCLSTHLPTEKWHLPSVLPVSKSELRITTEAPKPKTYILPSYSFGGDFISTNTELLKPTDYIRKTLPIYTFEEDASQNRLYMKDPAPPVFEAVYPVNITNTVSGNVTMGEYVKDTNAVLHSPATPQSFDLLPFQNSTQKIDDTPFDQPLGSSESIPLQQSLSGVDNLENFNNPPFDLQKRPTELHKLSLGDAAGLQLSLKYRGPWVSNLDVAKTIRNVPLPLPEPKTVVQVAKPEPEAGVSASKTSSAINAQSVVEEKNSRSSFEPKNEDSSFSHHSRKRRLALPLLPYFNFGMPMPKNRPFEGSRNSAELSRTEEVPFDYYSGKIATSGKKRVALRSSDFPSSDFSKPTGNLPVYPNTFFQTKNVLPHSSNTLTESSNVIVQRSNFLAQSSNGVMQSPDVSTSDALMLRFPNQLKKSGNIMMQPSDSRKQSSDASVPSPDPLKSSENVMMQFPNFQKQDVSSNLQKLPDVMMQTSKLLHTQNALVQPPNKQMQSSDTMIQPMQGLHSGGSMIHSPNVQTQSSDTPVQSPNAQQQLLDGMMQTHEVLHSEDSMMQPSNSQTQSSNVMMQPLSVMTQSENSMMQPSDNGIPSSDVMMSPPEGLHSENSMTNPSNLQTQSSDIVIQPLNTMTQSGNSMMEPSNVQKQFSDAKMKSIEVYNSDNSMMQPSNTQAQSSDTIMQSPDPLKSPENFMMQSPDVQKQSLDIMMQPPKVLHSEDSMIQPTNSPTQSSDVIMEPIDIVTQPPNILPQSMKDPELPNLNCQSQKEGFPSPVNEITRPLGSVNRVSTEPPFGFLNYPREGTMHKLKESHHKKHRIFSHLPLQHEKKHKHKHKHRNKSKKSVPVKSNNENDAYDNRRDTEEEYLAWSMMPGVRRQLNNLDTGLEFDNFFQKNLKMPKRGEDNPV